MWTWGQSRWGVDTAWAPSFTTTATGSSIVPYVDLNTIHNPATGTIAPAAWGDQVRDNLEFLIDPPACSVFHSTAQSLTTGTLTTLLANSENYDNAAMHSTVTNNSRITATTAGRYLITAAANFDANATGARLLGLLKNGSTVYDIQINNAGGTNNVGMIYTATVVLAVNDFVEMRARQSSGGNLNVTLLEFAAMFLTR